MRLHTLQVRVERFLAKGGLHQAAVVLVVGAVAQHQPVRKQVAEDGGPAVVRREDALPVAQQQRISVGAEQAGTLTE